MRILVSGSTGLIGSALAAAFAQQGQQVVRLLRSSAQRGSDDLDWDPEAGVLEASKLEGLDAVIHLAGKNIASGRWSERMKKTIRESRVRSTRLLCEALQKVRSRPRVLASASGASIYGNRGAEILSEESALGAGFLADVAKQWEEATEPASASGIRVVNLRFGIVLSPQGGALAKMLRPFKLGLGGAIGGGEQYWSWITIRDAVRAIQHAINSEALFGPLNVVSPEPVTNREFTQALGAALGRPAFLRMPAFLARIALGEMAEAALLSSTRVLPAKLTANGFNFLHPDLAEAFRSLLPK